MKVTLYFIAHIFKVNVQHSSFLKQCSSLALFSLLLKPTHLDTSCDASIEFRDGLLPCGLCCIFSNSPSMLRVYSSERSRSLRSLLASASASSDRLCIECLN